MTVDLATKAAGERGRVLILWARCRPVAEALRAELVEHFGHLCDFDIITDNPAGPNYIDLASAAIGKARQILILISAEDWTHSPYTHAEIGQIFDQIKDGIRSRKSVAFVKYLGAPLPSFAHVFSPLRFSNAKSLSTPEKAAFEMWLLQSSRPALVLREEILERPEGDYLLLNWLFGFDNTLWEATPTALPLNPTQCKDEVLRKLGLLKSLHSVHAEPGPLLGVLVARLLEQLPSARRRGINVKALRASLTNVIGGGETAAAAFRPVQHLVKTGLLPLLTSLTTRLGEVGMPQHAGDFATDLLSRLNAVVTAEEPFRNSLPEWVDGLGACIHMVTANESGVFLEPAKAREWTEHPEYHRSRILSDVRELYFRSLLLAIAIVVFFDLLKVQNAHLDGEFHDDLAKVIAFFADTSLGALAGPPGYTDPVVKMSNRLILHYIDAAAKFA